MINKKFHIIDDSGIKWWMDSNTINRAEPYCIQHHLPLRYLLLNDRSFICDDCPTTKNVPRAVLQQKEYIANKLKAQLIAKMEVINYNGELVPIAKTRSKDDEYGIKAQIMESRHGKQLVIYVGKKGLEGKSQIFVDLENHKLSFDHNDLKPTEIFAKIEATFLDGSKMSIQTKPEA